MQYVMIGEARGEAYIPLSPDGRARSVRIWKAQIRQHRRLRVICWMIGHRWTHRMVTDEVWPQHRGHYRRSCGRCWKTENLW